MDTLILLILAIAPCLAIGFFIYLKNKYKPSPPQLLLISVFYGICSFFLAVVIGLLLQKVTHIEDNMLDQLIRALVFVGLVEEGSKFVFLKGLAYRNKKFNQAFDGIVHAVMIGMGFAVAENMLYLYSGSGGSLVVRMISAVPAHAAFAVIMGYFVGEAKVFPSSAGLYSYMGLFFASLAHGYYDYFLFLQDISGIWYQSVVALVVVIIFTHFALKRRQNEEELEVQ